MCDCTHSHDDATDLSYAVKNALARAGATTENPTRQTFVDALNAVLRAEYHRIIDPIAARLREAEREGNEIARRANKQALDAAREELGEMFRAAFARFNKAWEGVTNGTMTFQRTAFDPTRDNDGPVDATDHGIAAGDDVVVMVSHKRADDNSRYVLLDGAGHRVCSGFDRQLNDNFPVCKHEMAWTLYQVLAPYVPVTDPAVDAVTTATDTHADAGTVTVEFPSGAEYTVTEPEPDTPRVAPTPRAD